MPTTKTGEVITWKEFGNRWKKGIEGITPLQQTKTQLHSTMVTLIGIICGIVISIIAYRSMWWLIIILVGALGNTLVGYLSLWQKKRQLIIIENEMKGGNQYGI